MDAKSFSRAEIGRAVQQECRDRDLHSFPTRRSSDLQVPISWISLLGTEVDWAYFTEPEPYLHGRKIFQPRGKVVGGSSSINAMIYIRGNRLDFDSWQALGNPGWSYEDVLPYFKKSENQQRGASEFHRSEER